VFSNSMVARETADAAFLECAGPRLQSEGFQLRRDGCWVKPVSAEIIHLVWLNLCKGGQFGILWGTAISFIPYQCRRGRAIFNLTRTNANATLWDALQDYGPGSPHGPPLDPIFVDGLSGDDRLRSMMPRVWANAQAVSLPWLTLATTLPGIAQLAERQIQHSGFGSYGAHWPCLSLVRAFVAARLGQAEFAERELHGIVTQRSDLQDEGETFMAALADVIAGRSKLGKWCSE
jgi:hypothetical protein